MVLLIQELTNLLDIMKFSKKNSRSNVLTESLASLKQQANGLLTKALDQHVTLAVTGLSRSGKTAFITSLVNQLVNHNSQSQLAFFEPVYQQRFIAAKRVAQHELHIPRFDYQGALSSFAEHPPQWPTPTKGISQIKLAIRYQPQQSLLKYATDMTTLYLNITDYPGEWLLDLPMLEQTYEEWSAHMLTLLEKEPRAERAKPFLDKVKSIDPFAEADESLLAELAGEYTELLHYYREQLGLSVIQPGRFILPGELSGAPILQFFPYPSFELIDGNEYQNAASTTNIGMLRARFIEYKERVVKRFYQDYFKHFDRQIVLADCLTPLNQGQHSFADLQDAINLILTSFRYGKSNILSRLFAPKIDKLLFAATKADHITPEQHQPLTQLLGQLVHSTKQELQYQGIETETIALASVNTTKAGKSQYQGKQVPVLQGRRITDDKLITLFPGTVPGQLPSAEQWQENSFNYVSFAPQTSISPQQTLPHIRVDQALQFLIGDKMA